MSLQITNLCNSKCTMCGIWKIYRGEDRRLLEGELAGPEWIRLVDRALARGVESFDVTGGEPFLKEGIADLLALMLRRTGFAAVTTNALQSGRILGAVRKVLAQAPRDSLFVVSVSLDGFDGTHAAVRGVRHGAARARELLRELGRLRREYPQLSQQISFTIMEENADEMPELMAEALRSGLIEEPDDFSFRPVASGHYYAQSNILENRRKVVRVIDRVQRDHEFRRTLPFVEKMSQSVLEPDRMILPCYAMFASLWIDPYGGVAPCVTMTGDVIGNVRETDFDILPIWLGHQAQQSRERIARDECAVCWTDCQALESIEYESAGMP